MAENSHRDERLPEFSEPLSKRARIVASIASIVLAVAGLAAVFLSGNQAGTALVIAVAALFGTVGLTGNLPTKLKFGDNEITMGIARAFEERIREADTDEAERLISAAVSALPQSDPWKTDLETKVFRRSIGGAIEELAKEYEDYTLQERERSMISFELEGPKHVGIAIHYCKDLPKIVPFGYIKELIGWADGSYYQEIVVITNGSLSNRGRERFERAKLQSRITWTVLEEVQIPAGTEELRNIFKTGSRKP